MGLVVFVSPKTHVEKNQALKHDKVPLEEKGLIVEVKFESEGLQTLQTCAKARAPNDVNPTFTKRFWWRPQRFNLKTFYGDY